MISVLCANPDSVYKSIPDLDVWDKQRNAYLFTGHNPVITHAPCQQWSRMRAFAKEDPHEKALAWFCLKQVLNNGRVFEHPAGSSFFQLAGISPGDAGLYSIDQSWFGFPCRKRTYLYFSKCKPLPYPVTFDAVEKTVDQLHSSKRSDTTRQFADWLIRCVKQVKPIPF